MIFRRLCYHRSRFLSKVLIKPSVEARLLVINNDFGNEETGRNKIKTGKKIEINGGE